MQSRTKLLTVLLAGAGVGIVAQYFLDPRTGRRRRALVVDKVSHWNAQLRRNFPKVLSDVRHQTQGLVAETKHLFEKEEPALDCTLEARIHSSLGRVVSHPGAIDVKAENGSVTLLGTILASELHPLLARVTDISGVKRIKNQLKVFERAEHISSLQGGQPRKDLPQYRQQNWSPAFRVMAGSLGALLFFVGGRQKSFRLRLVSRLLGGGLVSRAVTNLPFRRLTGIGAGRRAVDVQKTIHVKAPLEEVFQFFSRPEKFPEYMASVKSVERDYDGLGSHWELVGRFGIPIRWDAESTSVIADRLMAWKSSPGSLLRHSGMVHFEAEGPDQTRVHLQLHYNPPLGVLGHGIGKVFGLDAKHWLDDELVRVKMFLETGTRSHDVAISA